ncbi:dolichyl-phosphate mannose synthase [Oleiagrimonas soli]|uniref:Dolichyl-phosphate mannose synthase n=1 Tax=Oleiagrimonas soli TaxID=1543381 RepID=A0A099CUX5_9GAMM|nr:dolichyl-phosphate mannose synthase [Oleiagrimonas soli]
MLIPCLNEARAIRGVIASVLALGYPVMVVDDGSDDGTPNIVAALPVTLIRHPQRRGKGEALRTGFRAALKHGYDGVVSMDGDGQHVAEDIPRLLAAARRYPNHIVSGARLRHRERQPNYRRRANDFADWGISWAAGQCLVDTQCGQRYYPRAALELADIKSGGFAFETDILIEAALQRGVRVASVPIESRYLGDMRLSHFRPVRDFSRITARVVWRILRAGLMRDHLRQIRDQQPLIYDPEHETDAHG